MVEEAQGATERRGTCWVGGDGYDLAHIMMMKLERVLKPKKADLLAFIKDASAADSGEAAARSHLGISLGDLAASYLGPGDWSPRPM